MIISVSKFLINSLMYTFQINKNMRAFWRDILNGVSRQFFLHLATVTLSAIFIAINEYHFNNRKKRERFGSNADVLPLFAFYSYNICLA